VGSKLGLKAVLNTSFNESGHPMVASPIHALISFLRTDMDFLVINRLVIKKERQ
jgi:carbamoyltransferase